MHLTKREPKMCVYKQACATAREECYICDGFNKDCENYKLQIILESGYYLE